MIVFGLILLGLCFGSFTNALVWRIHEQAKPKKKRVTTDKDLSMLHGRSMCPHCMHTLAIPDLIPLFSWLWLKGRCRYCHKKIDDNPLVELLLPISFVISYLWWPHNFDTSNKVAFGVWLITLVGFAALIVYDLRWMLLPNKIVYPLIALAILHVLTQAVFFSGGFHLLGKAIISTGIAGGIFYLLYQFSNGKWIGGGDVKLGWLIGLILADPQQAGLMIFIASLLGTAISLPLIAKGSLKARSRIPFGPFLILSTMICKLFGASLIGWYTGHILGL